MGNVVNLNRFRKKKAKEAKQKRAETNRRLHGRNKVPVPSRPSRFASR